MYQFFVFIESFDLRFDRRVSVYGIKKFLVSYQCIFKVSFLRTRKFFQTSYFGKNILAMSMVIVEIF